ncbi:MAG: uncharacterized protein A8A55_2983 [Amphiamblys sp. WSBS2006]|nr:MAG: uncharacterized protein A8A55_2983 [Amphiamblys sp. WSBS2006]
MRRQIATETAAVVKETPEKQRVCSLSCCYCGNMLTRFAMLATSISDPSQDMFSTYRITPSVVPVYRAKNRECRCVTMETACRGCGNQVGYHIEQPCRQCTVEENNGHMWIFCQEYVTKRDTLSAQTKEQLYWPVSGPYMLHGGAPGTSEEVFEREDSGEGNYVDLILR